MESKKQLFIIIGSVVAMFALLYGAYAFTSQPTQTFFEQLTTVKESDHTKWSRGKTVFIKYSDFQCPACASYQSIIKDFEADPENKKITDQVTFVYRNFPLDQIHPNAREAAYAAEAAASQNAFYPFHDVLFEKQSEWSDVGDPYPLFEKYATDLNLDPEKFKSDYESDAVKEKVQNDYLSGVEVDVQGTPTFYLNGNRIRSPQSTEELRSILSEAIESSSTSQ